MLTQQKEAPVFLKGGGKMGELIRKKDWTSTALGNPDSWPQSLRTAISIILHSQFPMFIWWGDNLITLYNDAYSLMAGEKHPNALGESGNKVWSEIWDLVGPLADSVMKEGASTWAEDQLLFINRHGYIEESYFTFSYSPILDESGSIGGVLCTCAETTEKVLVQKKLRENENELQRRVAERTADLEQQKALNKSILNASFNGIYALLATRNNGGEIVDFEYLFANNNVTDVLGLKPDEIIGKSMLELIPQNKDNGFFDLFCHVLQTQKAVHDETHFVVGDIDKWYDFVIVPMDEETAVTTIQDITEQKLASLQIEQQRNLLDKIMKHSPSGIIVSEVIRNSEGEIKDAKVIMANDISETVTGIKRKDILFKTLSENGSDVMASPMFKNILQTLITGQPFTTQYYVEQSAKWLELSVARMDENRLINVISDITETKNAELEIVNSANRLSAVFNAAQTAMFTFSPVYEGDEIVDFRFVITNYNFTKYIGQTQDALQGTLMSQWFPDYFNSGMFEMYKQTFITGETIRKDIHYNVGNVNLYLDLLSTKVMDEVLVTFTDYTELKKTQLQLEEHIEELKRSNANLEEFTHAASHDLKEPIRKVSVFCNHLKRNLGTLNKEQEFLFSRVENATERMILLIDDLLEYSRVKIGVDLTEKVDLNKKLDAVIGDLEIAIEEKKAIINVGELPTVSGHRRQLQQLFYNLVQNSLKYSRQGVTPEITVTAETVLGKDAGIELPAEEQDKMFHLIKVQDNGIGFDQAYSKRIFRMFQRLHGKDEYTGSGVGLAIVRKVMENHKGFIAAESKLGEGSTFKILLPLENN